MAHNELTMDSNIIDVAFSRSGTRIAVLMNDCFSVFLWSLRNKPVVAPILESSYPLSGAPDSRPRQIAFLDENEVYILSNSAPNVTQIERTTLETRETKIAYQAADFEQLFSIFTALDHESLWFSHIAQPGKPVSYSSITPQSHDEFAVTACTQSPKADTYWADVVQISEDEVISRSVRFYSRMLTLAACFGDHDEDRGIIREQALVGEKLHLVPRYPGSFTLYHFSASAQICPLGQPRR